MRQAKENHWPQPLPSPDLLYADYYSQIHQLAHNIVCACCGCISHAMNDHESLGILDPALSVLTVDPSLVPFDFTCGIPELDVRHIMVDSLGITSDQLHLHICKLCHPSIQRNRLPANALANFRWIGPVPEELKGLTWIEELLIARGHLVGKVMRLQKRNISSYFGIKGHVILLPQETIRLLDLLPMPPSSLPDVARVVWTGRSLPDPDQLRHYFSVRKSKIYNALTWLVRNHEDYKDVRIDETEFSQWPPVFIATDLMQSMGHVQDTTAEDTERNGFATENMDTSEISGDIPITTSAILDTNDLSNHSSASSLQQLSTLVSDDTTINVVLGNSIRDERIDATYFTSSFPVLFPYGSAKHIDARRTSVLPFRTWIKLMLRHSSRSSLLCEIVSYC